MTKLRILVDFSTHNKGVKWFLLNSKSQIVKRVLLLVVRPLDPKFEFVQTKYTEVIMKGYTRNPTSESSIVECLYFLHVISLSDRRLHGALLRRLNLDLHKGISKS